MKVIAILGSPRMNGNTSTAARKILEEAQELGAETQEFVLNKISFMGCQACLGCKRTDHCVVKDGLTPVLQAVTEADAIILASPVYFGDVTGQFKSCFDRFYSFMNPDYSSRLQPGKRVAFVISQGAGGDSFDDVYPRYTQWFDMFGIADRHLLRLTNANAPTEASERPEVAKQASEIARHFVQGTASRE